MDKMNGMGEMSGMDPPGNTGESFILSILPGIDFSPEQFFNGDHNIKCMRD